MMSRRLAIALLMGVTAWSIQAYAETAETDDLGIALSTNVGFASPGGLLAASGRFDLIAGVFLEADAGWGRAGWEYGGGFGMTLAEQRAPTAKLGMANARWTISSVYTRSHLDHDPTPLHPLPDMTPGAGTYHWLAIMTGGDLKLDSGLFIVAEVGVTASLSYSLAGKPMNPPPQQARWSPAIRAGVGMHF